MSGRSYFAERLWSVVLGVAVVCIGGCGGSERPKTIPITGRVTINGQQPGEIGKIHFTPTEAAEGFVKRPAMGAFDVDGVYHVMSWTPDDGLVPGHYTVNVMPGDSAKTRIPKKYHQSGTSGLEVDVPVDQGPIEYDIEVLSSNANPNANPHPNANANPSGN